MQIQTRILPRALILILLMLSTTCTRFTSPKPGSFEVSLNVGIRNFAELNDTQEKVLEKAGKYRFRRISLSAVQAPLGVTFSEILHFQDLGIRVYFKLNRVNLIEIQEPFTGKILGKNLPLFEFKTPPGESWRERLVQEFGPPMAEVSGGRLRSFSLFYGWGDVAFNHMGPNEIALHRDPEMTTYRQQNFGRVVSFFE